MLLNPKIYHSMTEKKVMKTISVSEEVYDVFMKLKEVLKTSYKESFHEANIPLTDEMQKKFNFDDDATLGFLLTEFINSTDETTDVKIEDEK